MPLRLPDLPRELLEEIYPYVDIPFFLRITCRALRDAFTEPLVKLFALRISGRRLGKRGANPPKTKTAMVDVVKGVRLIAWACENGCHWSDRLAVRAASGGHEEALNYLYMFRDFEWNPEVPAAAAGNGRLETLAWLHANGVSRVWDQWTCNRAAAHGHLDCLEFAFNRNCPFSNSGLNEAARNGHYVCVEFMLTQNARDRRWRREESEACADAALGGHIRILQLLREYHLPWGKAVPEGSAIGGHLDCLKWLIEQGCPVHLESCFYYAAMNGRVNILHWIASDWTPDHDYFHPELLEEVAGQGPRTIPVLELAKEWDGDFGNAALLTCAVQSGHLDNIKWLVEQGVPLDHDGIPEAAATAGNLDVLNWVADQPDMFWGNATFDGAIMSHHVHVLEWAFNTRKVDGPWEGDCLARRVAQWGNLEMAKWVVDNDFTWGETANRANRLMAKNLAKYIDEEGAR